MKGRARSSPCFGDDSPSPLEGEAWISEAHTAAAGLPAGRLTPHPWRIRHRGSEVFLPTSLGLPQLLQAAEATLVAWIRIHAPPRPNLPARIPLAEIRCGTGAPLYAMGLVRGDQGGQWSLECAVMGRRVVGHPVPHGNWHHAGCIVEGSFHLGGTPRAWHAKVRTTLAAEKEVVGAAEHGVAAFRESRSVSMALEEPSSIAEGRGCDASFAAKNAGAEVHYAFLLGRPLRRKEIARTAASTPFELIPSLV